MENSNINNEKNLANKEVNSHNKSCMKSTFITVGIIGAITIGGLLFYNDTVASSKPAQEKLSEVKIVKDQQNIEKSKDDQFDNYRNQFDQMLHELSNLQRKLFWQNNDYIFDNVFSFRNRINSNITTYDKQYVLNIEVPGFDKDNIKIQIQGDYLDIYGKIIAEENKDKKNSQIIEEKRSSFQHHLLIPKDVDNNAITSSVKNGILTIILPRIARKKEEMKEIPIS